jgi:uncharacterized protein
MSNATVSALLSQISTYLRAERLRHAAFIFHGGEPLLAGQEFFRNFVREANAAFKGRVQLTYMLQTNGTLVTKEWLRLFRELHISFGISLDGPAEVNDRNRVDHTGAGSYAQVQHALQLVLADRGVQSLFDGILTVIDLKTDPLSLYHHWRNMGISRCDFLLPDGTHDNPPPGMNGTGSGTPYADWLIKIFDPWFANEDTKLSVRIFENIISLLFDPEGGIDSLGGGKNGLLVIETDGGIEPVDVLKICGPSFTKLGLNVHRNKISDAYSSPLVQLYQQGAAGVCGTCLTCPAVKVCGGGYLPHRYSRKNGFSNPSVYCRDLLKLITHIRSRVLESTTNETRKRLGLYPLSYEEAISQVMLLPSTQEQVPRGAAGPTVRKIKEGCGRKSSGAALRLNGRRRPLSRTRVSALHKHSHTNLP